MRISKLSLVIGSACAILVIGATIYFYVQMNHFHQQYTAMKSENEKLSNAVVVAENNAKKLTDKIDGIIDVYSFVYDMQEIDNMRENLFFALERDQDTLDAMYKTEDRKDLVEKLVSFQGHYTVDVLKGYYQLMDIDDKYIAENRSMVETLINIAVRMRDRESFNEIVKYKQDNMKGSLSFSWYAVTSNENFKNYLSKI